MGRCWRLAALLILSVGVLGVPTEARADQVDLPGTDEVRVTAFEGEREYRRHLASDPGPEKRLVDYVRTAECLYPPASQSPCPLAEPPLSLACEDGAPIAPLWRNERSAADAGWPGWQVRSDWACPEDLLPPFTREDLRKLRIEPITVNQQPSGGPILMRKPTIVYAEPSDRELRAVLFETWGVDVVMTPVEYTWDFGDGVSMTTAKPGRPYPGFDLTHAYMEPGSAQISLTTTWTGRYRIDADPSHRWRDVEGTATTVDVGVEFDIVELRSRLVDD